MNSGTRSGKYPPDGVECGWRILGLNMYDSYKYYLYNFLYYCISYLWVMIMYFSDYIVLCSNNLIMMSVFKVNKVTLTYYIPVILTPSALCWSSYHLDTTHAVEYGSA